MYEVEIKLLNGTIQRLITDSNGIGDLISKNLHNYHYFRILRQIPDEKTNKPKTRKRVKHG